MQAKETLPRTHTFAIGRQTGDLGERIGILERTSIPRIAQTLYGLVENHGDVAFTLSLLQGVPAVGSVLFNAQPTDGHTLILNDGTNPAVTFEFDSNNSVVQTGTLRQVVIGTTIAETAGNFARAVNLAPTLAITARIVPHNYQSPATIELTNDRPGTAGNVALLGTSTLTKTGMSGGTGAVKNIRTIAGSVASVAVVPLGRVEFTAELVNTDLDFFTFNATGTDRVLGELTLSFNTGEIEMRESYA
jgi:hypothetical protein